MRIGRLSTYLALLGSSACSFAGHSDPDATPRFEDAAVVPDATAVDARPPSDAEAQVVPLINEILKNPLGSDDDHEFIEIIAAPDADMGNFRIVILEGDADSGSTIGTVQNIFSIEDCDGAGFCVSGFFGDEIGNGSLSALLVSDPEPELVLDFDLDTDDDGALDFAPWAAISDSIALIDDPGDTGYSLVWLTDNADGLGQEYVGASRFPDGYRTGVPSDWVRANEEGDGLQGVAGASGELCAACGTTPSPAGQALITPGSPNAVQP